jgi:hypothetical protein
MTRMGIGPPALRRSGPEPEAVTPANAGAPLLFLAVPRRRKLDSRFRGNDVAGVAGYLLAILVLAGAVPFSAVITGLSRP